MADDDQAADGESAAAPKSKRKLITMIAAVAILAGAGGGWFFFFRGHGDQEHAEAAPPARPPVFMDVPEVLVNLAGMPGERVQYLKVKVVLEVKDQSLIEKVQPVLPRVTDIFQTYLRELRPADMNGSIGLFRLKEELTRRVNAAISPNQVNAVLFKEIVIQ